MTKPFTPKPGDKWTRDEDGMLWVYRKDCAVVFSRTGFTAGPVTCRSAHERDLPTPDALAQLREWGYEVSGDSVTSTTTPSGMVIETRYVFPGEFKIDPPITEDRVWEIVHREMSRETSPVRIGQQQMSTAIDKLTVRVERLESEATMDDGLGLMQRSQVREIVSEMLAAHPTPAESAATNELRVDLRDGDTWRGFGTSMVQVRGNRCRQCDATEVGEWFGADGIKNRDVFPFDKAIARLAKWGYRIDDFTTKPTPAEVREAAKVASDPNTKWHNITTKIVDPEKEAVAPEPVRWSDICNTPHSLRVAIDGPIMAKSPAWTGERVVIMDMPANIASPEPDWKGLLANLVEAVESANEADSQAASWFVLLGSSALAAAREHLARTNGGGK